MSAPSSEDPAQLPGVIFTQEAEAASYTGTGVGHMLEVSGSVEELAMTDCILGYGRLSISDDRNLSTPRHATQHVAAPIATASSHTAQFGSL